LQINYHFRISGVPLEAGMMQSFLFLIKTTSIFAPSVTNIDLQAFTSFLRSFTVKVFHHYQLSIGTSDLKYNRLIRETSSLSLRAESHRSDK